MKKIYEVSDVRFNSENGQVTYSGTRYNVDDSGQKDVRSYGDTIITDEDGVSFKKFGSQPSNEEVLAFAKTRVGDSDIETVYSDTPTR